MAKKRDLRNWTKDIFGNPARKPPKVAQRRAACLRCAKKFKIEAKLGRPPKYCCDECRKAAWYDQVAKFAKLHRGQSLQPATCRHCGKQIVIPRRRGRFPYFCSAECKRLALHPTLARGPDLFDPGGS